MFIWLVNCHYIHEILRLIKMSYFYEERCSIVQCTDALSSPKTLVSLSLPIFLWAEGASVHRLELNTQKKKRSNYERVFDSYLRVLLNGNNNRLNLDLSLLAEQSDVKFRPPPRQIKDGTMAHFGFHEASSLITGGMGVNSATLFCPRL